MGNCTYLKYLKFNHLQHLVLVKINIRKKQSQENYLQDFKHYVTRIIQFHKSIQFFFSRKLSRPSTKFTTAVPISSKVYKSKIYKHFQILIIANPIADAKGVDHLIKVPILKNCFENM